MTNLSSFQKYQEQYVNTLTPGELVTLLYNEIIKNLNKSVIMINSKKINEAHNNIIKAQDILLNLIGNLNFNYTVSSNFLSLYEYMYDSLIKANIEKNVKKIQHIASMVSDLKDTWVEADKISRVNSNAIAKSI